MVSEESPGRVMALRNGRVSKATLPVVPNVKTIEVRFRTEYVKGRAVIRLFLPDGSTITTEPRGVT